MRFNRLNALCLGGVLAAVSFTARSDGLPNMASGLNGYKVESVFTVGETIVGASGALNTSIAGRALHSMRTPGRAKPLN